MKKLDLDDSLLLGDGMEIFMDSLMLRGLSGETVRGYQIDIEQFRKWMVSKANGPVFVSEIKTEHFEDFIEHLMQEKQCKPRTINRKINAMSAFFNCMVKKKYIQDNPLESFERMKVNQTERIYLTGEEIEAIINAIEQPIVHYFAIMMAHTGIRIRECIQLQLKDVDLDDRIVHVINGKGGKNRSVPMSPGLVEHMKEYLANHRPPTESLCFFALKKTGTISEQYVNRLLKQACAKAGIKKHVTSHILRHSFASYLVKKDTHIAVIQRLLGHASLKTTSIYLHVQQDDLQDAVNRIDY